jgi:hypothetical protein
MGTKQTVSNILKVGGDVSDWHADRPADHHPTGGFTLFGPALVAVGVPAVNAAVAGAHLAMAGQGMPPRRHRHLCGGGVDIGHHRQAGRDDPLDVLLLF